MPCDEAAPCSFLRMGKYLCNTSIGGDFKWYSAIKFKNPDKSITFSMFVPQFF